MRKKMPFKREFSAGGVVYKKFKGLRGLRGLRFLLGKHSGYHKWVLPKGLIEKGERGGQTALRETEEEMGVKAKLVLDKPIHKETYFYVADFKEQSQISNDKFLISKPQNHSVRGRQIPSTKFPSFAKATKGKQNSRPEDDQPLAEKLNRNTRRVAKYEEQGGEKTKVFKTVTFYLLEYVSGSPEDHGWEMEEAGWFGYEEALEKMAFKGEKKALKKAKKILESDELQLKLV